MAYVSIFGDDHPDADKSDSTWDRSLSMGVHPFHFYGPYVPWMVPVCDPAGGACRLRLVVPAAPDPSYSASCAESANRVCRYAGDSLACEVGVRSAVQGVDPPRYTGKDEMIQNSSAAMGYRAAMDSCKQRHNGWQILF